METSVAHTLGRMQSGSRDTLDRKMTTLQDILRQFSLVGDIDGVHGEGRLIRSWSRYGLGIKQKWFICKVITSIRPIRKLTTVFVLLDIYWLPPVIWCMLNIQTDSRALKPGNRGAKFFREVLSNKFLFMAFFFLPKFIFPCSDLENTQFLWFLVLLNLCGRKMYNLELWMKPSVESSGFQLCYFKCSHWYF